MKVEQKDEFMEQLEQSKEINLQEIKTARKQSYSADNEKPYCPACGSEKVYGMSRVVGYFSIIDNWNKSKREELKRRQKGNYWFKEE